ncbi:MAG: DNA alkylation repair protein [Methanoregulaceae archaeon]|jgi:3-methyladenine DNA glycosylase AlkD|nr:DNA alkylation repair protein [Methanoregulaceae archaeon]
MDQVIAAIRKELTENSDPSIRESSKRFFKEEITCYGMKTATVTAIAKKYWKEIRSQEKYDIFALCEELYRSGYLEEAFIVSTWVPSLSDRFEPGDLSVFEYWIDRWITNWAACDGFCNHAVGELITKFPDQVVQLKRWAASPNRWMRRAACVSLIVPAKHGEFLSDVFELADLVLIDQDAMVQKGYGWLLKEASRKHIPEVFAYVMQNRAVMPRTALRYAIELMPQELKSEAMKKG